MHTFEVTANGIIFGIYEAATHDEACELCAQDAGYKSVADMEHQLEGVSKLEARIFFGDEEPRGSNERSGLYPSVMWC